MNHFTGLRRNKTNFLRVVFYCVEDFENKTFDGLNLLEAIIFKISLKFQLDACW